MKLSMSKTRHLPVASVYGRRALRTFEERRLLAEKVVRNQGFGFLKMSATARNEASLGALVRGIDEMNRLVSVYLSRIEGALTSYYDSETAIKDCEAAMMSIDFVEKIFAAQGGMSISSADAEKDSKDVQQSAMASKTAAESEFQKMANAAAMAATRFNNNDMAARPSS